jgi:hypothetical protein
VQYTILYCCYGGTRIYALEIVSPAIEVFKYPFLCTLIQCIHVCATDSHVISCYAMLCHAMPLSMPRQERICNTCNSQLCAPVRLSAVRRRVGVKWGVHLQRTGWGGAGGGRGREREGKREWGGPANDHDRTSSSIVRSVLVLRSICSDEALVDMVWLVL